MYASSTASVVFPMPPCRTQPRGPALSAGPRPARAVPESARSAQAGSSWRTASHESVLLSAPASAFELGSGREIGRESESASEHERALVLGRGRGPKIVPATASEAVTGFGTVPGHECKPGIACERQTVSRRARVSGRAPGHGFGQESGRAFERAPAFPETAARYKLT